MVAAAKPVAVKLDLDTRQRIKRLADARSRSVHWMMCDAIQTYLDREEKREALRQDAIRAWDEYQDTGLHVTQQEADTWLEDLEAGRDAEPPECHV